MDMIRGFLGLNDLFFGVLHSGNNLVETAVVGGLFKLSGWCVIY